MAMLLNPRTGQVRGFLRDLPDAKSASAQAPGGQTGPAMKVLFSRGIPDAPAWRHRH